MSEMTSALPTVNAASRCAATAGLEQSAWALSAGSGPSFASLQEDRNEEIVVVGAGYAGLSTAIALLQRGAQVTVVDAGEPGSGASGRNGGQVIPFFKRTPDSLRSGLGKSVADDLIRFVISSADAVFDLIGTHRIECDAVRTGWIQAARGPAGESVLRDRCRTWAACGLPCEPLSASDVARLSGTGQFRGGWVVQSAGSVHPLKFARGLAGVVQKLGGTVLAHSPVQSLERKVDRWSLLFANGRRINAAKVVLATNGYTTDLWPGLRKSIVPVYSMQIATVPLPLAIGADILAGGQTMTDSNHLVHYFRRDVEGRFIMGSRAPFKDLPDDSATRRLIMRTRQMYPQLANIDFPIRWAGRVAMTTDSLPHLHQLAPGLTTALGFNGRGVALATAIGKTLAAATLGDSPSTVGFPMTSMTPIAFHRIHRLGVRMMIEYYRLADKVHR